jgi:tRNA A37 N6-isopentenylltransferase MiaA
MTISLSEIVKKVGRPVGSKNKPKAKKIILTRSEVELANKVGVSTEDYAKQKLTLRKKPKVAAANKDRLNDLRFQQELLARIKNLEHQAIGYRAVISYLSHQLELKP